MELVLCQLTVENLDQDLVSKLNDTFPQAKVVLCKCIGCCGACATTYVCLKDGRLIEAESFLDLVRLLML